MRTRVRNLIEKAQGLSGAGAKRNAELEVEQANRSVVELDRQLRRVCDPSPRRAA